MSLDHAFFYKSVNGDRVYDDASFEHWLKKFFTSGVFLNDLQVTANEDMTVTVGAGYVNAEGKVKIFESASSLIIETAGATYPRIDSIVLERNDTERDILLKVVKGGYSSEPVAHTPVRQDGVYQLVIAQILVNAGAVKVTQANITDTRNNTELCGIVAGAVDQIDFSQVQAQFDSYFAQYKTQIAADYTAYNEDMEGYLNQMSEDFSAWFEGIRNQLDEDSAGHLQNQIGSLENLGTENKANLVEAVNELKEENVNIVERLDNGDIDTLTSIEQVVASTEPEKPVGAGAVKELNESLYAIIPDYSKATKIFECVDYNTTTINYTTQSDGYLNYKAYKGGIMIGYSNTLRFGGRIEDEGYSMGGMIPIKKGTTVKITGGRITGESLATSEVWFIPI